MYCQTVLSMLPTLTEVIKMSEHKKTYRHEWKYLVSYPEADLLFQRLSPFLSLDKNAVNGEYMIRSLYFDDMIRRKRVLLSVILVIFTPSI